jgi:methionine synthase II (cobalamin-independent)
MTLQQNTERIQTTHIGSLPRPHAVLDLMKAKLGGKLIAERIVRFARLVGRENVLAGADCGFSSQALYRTEVHPTVIWEKFKALRQGADLATRQLWGRH